MLECYSLPLYLLIINTDIMHPDFWIETHFSGYQLGSDTTRGYLSSYVYQPHQSLISLTIKWWNLLISLTIKVSQCGDIISTASALSSLCTWQEIKAFHETTFCSTIPPNCNPHLAYITTRVLPTKPSDSNQMFCSLTTWYCYCKLH